jgi:hypothetical protein
MGVTAIDSFQGGGETIGVALATHLAISDDIDARTLHLADSNHGRIVLRQFEQIF